MSGLTSRGWNINVKETDDLVSVRPLVTHIDDRGMLFECLRNDDEEFVEFGQVYVVRSNAGAIRAFHKHNEMWDWFVVLSGNAKFIFYKVGEDRETLYQVVNVRGDVPTLISVPPGVWHGWCALSDTTLLSIASAPYNRSDPDEERTTYRAMEMHESWNIAHR